MPYPAGPLPVVTIGGTSTIAPFSAALNGKAWAAVSNNGDIDYYWDGTTFHTTWATAPTIGAGQSLVGLWVQNGTLYAAITQAASVYLYSVDSAGTYTLVSTQAVPSAIAATGPMSGADWLFRSGGTIYAGAIGGTLSPTGTVFPGGAQNYAVSDDGDVWTYNAGATQIDRYAPGAGSPAASYARPGFTVCRPAGPGIVIGRGGGSSTEVEFYDQTTGTTTTPTYVSPPPPWDDGGSAFEFFPAWDDASCLFVAGSNSGTPSLWDACVPASSPRPLWAVGRRR